jgi:hypothetical protein
MTGMCRETHRPKEMRLDAFTAPLLLSSSVPRIGHKR